MKKRKSLPKFKAEERKFWNIHDSTDYLDWSKAERALSKPQAIDDGDFNTSSAGFAGADQDRRQQARRALSVTDQDVARGEGGINWREGQMA